MANYTSTHTGAVIDASVTKVSASGVTQADFTKLNAVTSSATELNLLDGVTSTTAEINILDGVTSTAAEINILDGATLSVTELNYLDGADSSITTLSLPDNTTITAFGASLIDDANASTARTTLNVDVAGTDNSTNVTLVTTSYDYLSLSGQAITLGQIDISDDTNLVGGDGLALTGDTLSVNVDDSSIEINSDTLRVKALGISNAMLGGSIANAKLSNSSVSYGGISLSLGGSDATPAFDLSDATSLPIIAGTTGTLTVARGGTGATTASGARTNLNVDVAGTDNSTDVTLVTTSHDYLSISGQAVTLGQVDISDDTNLVGGTGITLTGDTLSTTDSEIVHDDLSGFVSNEHIDHSSVSITAGTGLSGGGDITSTRTLTTDDSAIVHDDLSGFVANEHIDHSGVSITAGAGLTGGGDITATRDIAVGAGTGVTVNADDIAIGQDVGTNADVTFNSVIADNFIGSLDGAVKFEAKATVALNKGDAVYVVGVSGNTPTIALADANDATKMPSFGLVGSSASIDDVVEVVTFGTLKNINTSSFSEGDILFITSNGTAGNTLTATKEGGESVLCQNIGKVIRSHATVGSIKVGGAGRANATPNLNDGNIFIGNGSNQAVSASLNTKIEDYLDGGTSTANFDTISVDGAEITATPAELNVLDGITSTTAELNYTDGVTSNIQTQLDLKAPLASPAFTGTATGANLTLSGDLTVNGSTTTLDTTNLAVEDNLMELNAGVTSNANDSGFLIERGSTGDNAIFMWDESADKFTLGTTTATGTTTGDITLSSTGTLVANVEGGVTGAVTGNADTATTLATARNFSLTGDVTAGAVSFDGSGNVALSTTIAANSVALGTDTTGNYMSDLTEGTGIDISHTPAEGSNGTITLDLTEVGFGGGANRLITDDGDGTVSTEANLTFDGNYLRLSDNKLLIMGAGDAFQIGHKATYSNIATYEGHLYIDNNADDQDIIFRCDDGSGGIATYITLDGSISKTTLSKDLRAVDNVKITAGNADDLQLYHDGTNSTLQNNTGTLSIIQNTDNGNMVFKNDNGSGGTASYFYLDGTNERTQFDKGAKFVDNAKIQVGTGVDLEIYHNGTNSFIDNNTGYLQIAQKVSDADIFIEVNDGGGAINAIVIDSSEVGRVKLPNDNQYLSIGASGDLYFFHDGTNSVIRNATGDLVLRNDEADQDIILQTDDGSGGIATYITLDGSATSIEIAKKMQFPASHSADKIVMYSGGNEKIGTEANTLLFTADNYKFKDTNGDVNLFMNNSGQVGIGTNSPNMKLNISHGDQDGLRFNCTSTTGEAFIDFGDSGDNDAGSLRYDHNDNSMKFRVNASERMRINSSGNVGIGTQSPTDTLQVEGSIGVGVGRDAQLTSVNNGLAIRNLVSNADMFFYVNDGGVDTEAMRIDGATANVGIGTTSPGAALEVKDYFQIEASSSYMGILGFNRNVNTGAILNGSYGAYQLHNYQGKLQLQVYNSSGTAVDQNALVVDNSANVGIGTTSPDSKLQVEYTTTSNGSAAIAEFGTSGSGAIANSGHQVIIGGPSVGGYTGAMIYSDSTSGVGQISFADGRGANDSWRGTIAYEHANDRMEFWTNATEKIAINSDGDFIPAGDGTQDLGASSKRWGVIYSADLDLSNEGSENDVDGTWGSYVIQEGEEDLFLINRRSGKKYKFMLQEVQD